MIRRIEREIKKKKIFNCHNKIYSRAILFKCYLADVSAAKFSLFPHHLFLLDHHIFGMPWRKFGIWNYWKCNHAIGSTHHAHTHWLSSLEVLMCEYKLHVKTCNLCLKYGLKYCFVLRFSPSFMSFYYDLCMHRSMSIWFFEQGGLNDYKSNFLMYIKYLHLVQHHLKVHIATLNFFA